MGLSLGLSDALVGLSRAENLGGGAAATSAGVPEGAPAASMLGVAVLLVAAETSAGDPEGAPAASMPFALILSGAGFSGTLAAAWTRAEDRLVVTAGIPLGDPGWALAASRRRGGAFASLVGVLGWVGVVFMVLTGLNSAASSSVMVCAGLRLYERLRPDGLTNDCVTGLDGVRWGCARTGLGVELGCCG